MAISLAVGTESIIVINYQNCNLFHFFLHNDAKEKNTQKKLNDKTDGRRKWNTHRILSNYQEGNWNRRINTLNKKKEPAWNKIERRNGILIFLFICYSLPPIKFSFRFGGVKREVLFFLLFFIDMLKIQLNEPWNFPSNQSKKCDERGMRTRGRI